MVKSKISILAYCGVILLTCSLSNIVFAQAPSTSAKARQVRSPVTRTTAQGNKLTNQDVIGMVSLGLSDDVIVEKIRSASVSDFDTSVAGLKELKANKVSDRVLQAMINPHPAVTGPNNVAPANQLNQPPSPVPTEARPSSPVPTDAGAYVMQHGELVEMMPEIVGWQTGGVIKSVATAAIVKGDVNGKITKPSSALRLANPLVFIIKTTEDEQITEYQLLRLHPKGNRREFRAVTGGVFHVSSDSKRDAIDYEVAKLASRVWKITLNLEPGEYGFLPPGLMTKSISSSGKIYTFSVMTQPATWTTSASLNTPATEQRHQQAPQKCPPPARNGITISGAEPREEYCLKAGK